MYIYVIYQETCEAMIDVISHDTVNGDFFVFLNLYLSQQIQESLEVIGKFTQLILCFLGLHISTY